MTQVDKGQTMEIKHRTGVASVSPSLLCPFFASSPLITSRLSAFHCRFFIRLINTLFQLLCFFFGYRFESAVRNCLFADFILCQSVSEVKRHATPYTLWPMAYRQLSNCCQDRSKCQCMIWFRRKGSKCYTRPNDKSDLISNGEIQFSSPDEELN